MLCPRCRKEIPKKVRFCIHCSFDFSTISGYFGSDLLPSGFVLDRRFRVIEYVTSGGMANVYRVRDIRLDKDYALKEMIDNFRLPGEREMAVERFKREAEILSRLTHPSIPRIIDHFVENDRYYLVMDFIEGKDLDTLLEENEEGRFSQDQVKEWIWQIIDVLGYLHDLNPPVIYRDLKPSNILLTEDGRIFLIDFGIARIFSPKKQGTLIGTPGYAPPEQYKGQVDARSDIFALGATLHHLLTGKDPREDAPFSFPPVKKLLPDIDEALAKVINKSLAYDVEDRIGNITEFSEMLASSNNIDQARKYYNEGLNFLKNGSLPEAEQALTKSLSLNPKNAWAFIYRGKTREISGNIDRAADDYNSAVKLAPDNPESHFHLGSALKIKGDLDSAEESLGESIDLDHGFYKAYHCLGEIYSIREEWEQAIILFEKAILANENFQPARESLESTKKKKNMLERIRKFDQSASDEMDPAKAHFKLARYFMEWERLDEAEEEFIKAKKVLPDDPDVYEAWGILKIKRKDYKKAADLFGHALVLAPERVHLYYDTAEAYIKQQKYNAALEFLQIGINKMLASDSMLESDPAFLDMIYLITEVLDNLGKSSPDIPEIRKEIEKGELNIDRFMIFWQSLKMQ